MPIAFENVSHTYSAGTPYEYQALRNINLEITEGKMTAIIGQTGSGKSTLVQHLNALLLPDAGIVHILDRDIKAGEKAKKLKALRGEVGLVFQFPEYQLFEEELRLRVFLRWILRSLFWMSQQLVWIQLVLLL